MNLPSMPKPDPNKKKFPSLLHAHIGLLLLVLFCVIAEMVVFSINTMLSLPFTPTDPAAKTSFGLEMCDLIVRQLLCMLPAMLLALLFSKSRPSQAARLKKSISPLQILLLCGIGLGCLYLVNGINDILILGMEQFGHQPKNVVDFSYENLPQMIYASLLIAGLPAICEEFVFRGVVLRAYERVSPTAAVLMSALLFGLLHGNVDQFFFAFMLGIVLAVVVLLTDSIWASVVIHFFNNALASVLNYFLLSSGQESSAPATAAELLVSSAVRIAIGAGIFGVAMLLFVLCTRRRNRRKYGRALPEELAPGFAGTIAEKKYDYFLQREVSLSPAGKSPAATWLTLVLFVGYCLLSCYIYW